MRNQVKPGQTWKWKQPNGDWRYIFIQRVGGDFRCSRVYGYHPISKKNATVSLSILVNGTYDATLMDTDEDFVHVPVSLQHKIKSENYYR